MAATSWGGAGEGPALDQEGGMATNIKLVGDLNALASQSEPDAAEVLYRAAVALDQVTAALLHLRHICSEIPIVERNPKFAEANRAALQALTQAGAW